MYNTSHTLWFGCDLGEFVVPPMQRQVYQEARRQAALAALFNHFALVCPRALTRVGYAAFLESGLGISGLGHSGGSPTADHWPPGRPDIALHAMGLFDALVRKTNRHLMDFVGWSEALMWISLHMFPGSSVEDAYGELVSRLLCSTVARKLCPADVLDRALPNLTAPSAVNKQTTPLPEWQQQYQNGVYGFGGNDGYNNGDRDGGGRVGCSDTPHCLSAVEKQARGLLQLALRSKERHRWQTWLAQCFRAWRTMVEKELSQRLSKSQIAIVNHERRLEIADLEKRLDVMKTAMGQIEPVSQIAAVRIAAAQRLRAVLRAELEANAKVVCESKEAIRLRQHEADEAQRRKQSVRNRHRSQLAYANASNTRHITQLREAHQQVRDLHRALAAQQAATLVQQQDREHAIASAVMAAEERLMEELRQQSLNHEVVLAQQRTDHDDKAAMAVANAVERLGQEHAATLEALQREWQKQESTVAGKYATAEQDIQKLGEVYRREVETLSGLLVAETKARHNDAAVHAVVTTRFERQVLAYERSAKDRQRKLQYLGQAQATAETCAMERERAYAKLRAQAETHESEREIADRQHAELHMELQKAREALRSQHNESFEQGETLRRHAREQLRSIQELGASRCAVLERHLREMTIQAHAARAENCQLEQRVADVMEQRELQQERGHAANNELIAAKKLAEQRGRQVYVVEEHLASQQAKERITEHRLREKIATLETRLQEMSAPRIGTEPAENACLQDKLANNAAQREVTQEGRSHLAGDALVTAVRASMSPDRGAASIPFSPEQVVLLQPETTVPEKDKDELHRLRCKLELQEQTHVNHVQTLEAQSDPASGETPAPAVIAPLAATKEVVALMNTAAAEKVQRLTREHLLRMREVQEHKQINGQHDLTIEPQRNRVQEQCRTAQKKLPSAQQPSSQLPIMLTQTSPKQAQTLGSAKAPPAPKQLAANTFDATPQGRPPDAKIDESAKTDLATEEAKQEQAVAARELQQRSEQHAREAYELKQDLRECKLQVQRLTRHLEIAHDQLADPLWHRRLQACGAVRLLFERRSWRSVSLRWLRWREQCRLHHYHLTKAKEADMLREDWEARTARVFLDKMCWWWRHRTEQKQRRALYKWIVAVQWPERDRGFLDDRHRKAHRRLMASRSLFSVCFAAQMRAKERAWDKLKQI